MIMNMELLPCPFCGAGTTRVVMNGQTWTGTKYSDPISVSVIHHCDPVEGQPSRLVERVGRDEESAIAAWNRRASPASVPEGFTMSEPEILPDGSGFGTMTEREATLLGKVERQSAALKLAREALFDMQDSYAAVHGWKDSFVIAATTAIAAIDSLQKGE